MFALYHLAMVGVDVAALWALRRQPTAGRWALAGSAAGLAALILAVGLGSAGGKNPFRVASLLGQGLFVHVPLLAAAGGAWLARPQPWAAAASGLAALALSAIAFDAYFVEPTWLETVRYRLSSEKLSRPVRVVVVADLQIDSLGAYEREALARAVAEGPDLLLFAGDYTQADPETDRRLREGLNDLLRSLGGAPRWGAYAVRGNVDSDAWLEIFAGTGVTAVERTDSFELGELRLTCLGMNASFRPWETRAPGGEPGRFHLVLGHSPNFALARLEADLLVAGHTHGGQVRLPGVGPLATSARVPRRWAAGRNLLPSGATLVVSRGVGMERGDAPRLRFLCRPELAVIDLVPATGSL